MKRTSGFVLLGLLVLMALLGATVAGFSQSWADQRQRERESELLFIGQQYRAALESYYLASPGPVKHLPVTLEDLLRDPRFPNPVRHLRRAWADPLSPATPWGVIRRGSQIIGVYSQAPGEPFRRHQFDPGLESFEGARRYADWQFIFVPRRTGAAVPAAVPSPKPLTDTAAMPPTSP